MGWAGVAMQVLGAYGNWKAQRESAIAEGQAMAQQATNAIQSLNYSFMNYEIERRDSFDSAVADLTKNAMSSRVLVGGVENAVSEEMGDSNTGRLINRSTNAEGLRAQTSIKDNYAKTSDEISLNKEQALLSTKQFIAGLHPPKLPSYAALALGMAGAGIQSWSQMQNAEAFKETHYHQSDSSNVNAKVSLAPTYDNNGNALSGGYADWNTISTGVNLMPRQYGYNKYGSWNTISTGVSLTPKKY